MLYESYGFGDWLVQGLLLTVAIAAPLLASDALMSGRRLPTFVELIGPREGRSSNPATVVLGLTLIVTTLIAAQIALGLVFDPRSRDFPFAGLTMAVVPFLTLTLLNRPKPGARTLAEAVFAGLFAVAALYVLFNEGPDNWQSAWTSAAYLLFGSALWPTYSIAIPGKFAARILRSPTVLFGEQDVGVAADRRRLNPGVGVDELVE